MEDPKFTKGPWFMSGYSMSGKPHYNVTGTVLGGKFKIANVPWVDGCKYDMQEAEANAKLIAAAPEMYKALKNIVDYLSSNPTHRIYPNTSLHAETINILKRAE